ncbi:MAG: rRNA pseudouridine synthase [Candidatus Pacebacteria bacterium]|nr:rRNA pseudouridine synthase [Candidatus Paceibacterota bacterium]
MELTFPMRINKYLAHTGHATRLGADALIKEGKVLINGRRAALGDQVQQDDVVEVKGGAKRTAAHAYFAYHKPRGVITHSPQMDEEDIKSATGTIPELAGTFPIGRLDKDSSGLIILTNDGRVTDRMLNPRYEHEKQYVVRTVRPLRTNFKQYMEIGVDIEGYHTKPCKVQIMGEKVFRITLTEGKKHQIRRMVVAMHNEVRDLERTAIMNVTLGKLKKGAWRKIEGAELATLLSSLGLQDKGGAKIG